MGQDGGETKVQIEGWRGREERGTERGVERLKKTMYSITNQNYLVTLTVTHKSDDCVLTPLHYSLVLFQLFPGPCQVQLVLEWEGTYSTEGTGHCYSLGPRLLIDRPQQHCLQDITSSHDRQYSCHYWLCHTRPISFFTPSQPTQLVVVPTWTSKPC